MQLERPLVKTLDRYVLKRFFGIYLANLFCFSLIFILIDSVMRFDEFLRLEQGFWATAETWARYYSGMTPIIFCQILGPVISVTAALFAVTSFLRANELTPVLATGRSYQRTLLPILVASLVVSAGTFLVQELWLPRTSAALRETVDDLSRGRAEDNVKHLDATTGQLIVFRTYERYQRKASGVLVLPAFSIGDRQRLIHARSAEWLQTHAVGGGLQTGYWLLRDGWVQEWDERYRLVIHPPDADDPAARPRLSLPFAERTLETNMIPEDLERRETTQMTLAQLRRKAETSPQQSVWTVRYYSRFGYAVTNFTLVLLGIPITVYFASRNLIFGALLSLGIATAYFVANSICQDLAVQGRISPALGGALAPLLFISLGASLYRGIRT